MPRKVTSIAPQSSETIIRQAVQERYAKLALQSECCGEDCCTGSTCRDLRGDSVPEEAAQISAGCGSPITHAKIAKEQIVVDLGSGGGVDVFRASGLVGPNGRVIGIDATPEMIFRARETARKNRVENVEFRLGEIEHMPLEGNFADWVVSNCVINLAPDKEAVFGEAFRILKHGGQLVVSDIVAELPIPQEARNRLTDWAACLTGAILEDEYLNKLSKAGFIKVRVLERNPLQLKSTVESATQKLKLASLTISAIKPQEERN